MVSISSPSLEAERMFCSSKKTSIPRLLSSLTVLSSVTVFLANRDMLFVITTSISPARHFARSF